MLIIDGLDNININVIVGIIETLKTSTSSIEYVNGVDVLYNSKCKLNNNKEFNILGSEIISLYMYKHLLSFWENYNGYFEGFKLDLWRYGEDKRINDEYLYKSLSKLGHNHIYKFYNDCELKAIDYIMLLNNKVDINSESFINYIEKTIDVFNKNPHYFKNILDIDQFNKLQMDGFMEKVNHFLNKLESSITEITKILGLDVENNNVSARVDMENIKLYSVMIVRDILVNYLKVSILKSHGSKFSRTMLSDNYILNDNIGYMLLYSEYLKYYKESGKNIFKDLSSMSEILRYNVNLRKLSPIYEVISSDIMYYFLAKSMIEKVGFYVSDKEISNDRIKLELSSEVQELISNTLKNNQSLNEYIYYEKIDTSRDVELFIDILKEYLTNNTDMLAELLSSGKAAPIRHKIMLNYVMMYLKSGNIGYDLECLLNKIKAKYLQVGVQSLYQEFPKILYNVVFNLSQQLLNSERQSAKEEAYMKSYGKSLREDTMSRNMRDSMYNMRQKKYRKEYERDVPNIDSSGNLFKKLLTGLESEVSIDINYNVLEMLEHGVIIRDNILDYERMKYESIYKEYLREYDITSDNMDEKMAYKYSYIDNDSENEDDEIDEDGEVKQNIRHITQYNNKVQSNDIEEIEEHKRLDIDIYTKLKEDSFLRKYNLEKFNTSAEIHNYLLENSKIKINLISNNVENINKILLKLVLRLAMYQKMQELELFFDKNNNLYIDKLTEFMYNIGVDMSLILLLRDNPQYNKDYNIVLEKDYSEEMLLIEKELNDILNLENSELCKHYIAYSSAIKLSQLIVRNLGESEKVDEYSQGLDLSGGDFEIAQADMNVIFNLTD